MNVWDILILLAVIGAATGGMIRRRARKKAGKGCCGSGCCGDCALCGSPCEHPKNS